MATTETVSNEAQLNYLGHLWAERTDEPFPIEKFTERSTLELSALIDRVMKRPPLPPTEEQLDEIAGLRSQLGFDEQPVENRKHANLLIPKLHKAIRARAYYARLEAADKELDQLLTAPF